MTRMILSLEDQDKAWLEQQAARRGVSMAEVVRGAIRSQRESEEAPLSKVLAATRGKWRAGDGLRYQRRVRAEWD